MVRAFGHRCAGHLPAVALGLACLGAPLPSGHAAPATAVCARSTPLNAPIARAAQRFVIPEALIRAVIALESGGAVLAVSPKGAMGLMQLMPGTWAELRRRYALGRDPFDPCDNIFAGTAYLRELLDRYGDPGFLAAYNAGPGRYEAYLTGRPLPPETIAYVAHVSGQIIGGGPAVPGPALPDPDAWRRGDLFVRASQSRGDEPLRLPETDPAALQDKADLKRSAPPRASLFVPRTDAPR